MSRFHWSLLAALTFVAAGWMLHSVVMMAVVAAVFLLVAGLGVALPAWQFFGPFICRGNAGQRRVALTYDDGPDPRTTPALLDLLRDKGVTATFFCIGRRVAEHPDLAARIVREGHLLGNHTYNHHPATNVFTTGRLQDEMQRTQAVIEQATGFVPRWFRPPMGLTNPRVFRAARALNFQVIGWSARSLDTITGNPEKIVARVRRKLGPGGIILLHDGNLPVGRVLTTTRLLLDNLGAEQYEVVRLDKLLA